MTDPISDMLTRIRNALRAKKADVYIPFSKLKLEMIKILKNQGFIAGFEEIKAGGDQKFGGLKVILKYADGQPAITKLERISKPGRRVYGTREDLPRVLSGYGIAIVSTSQGIMTNVEAKKAKLGGEVLCEIY